VWVVEAKLKEGTKHIYPAGRFTSTRKLAIIAVDQSLRARSGASPRARDQLLRRADLLHHAEVHIDLEVGRYLAIGLDNEHKMYDFSCGGRPTTSRRKEVRREGVAEPLAPRRRVMRFPPVDCRLGGSSRDRPRAVTAAGAVGPREQFPAAGLAARACCSTSARGQRPRAVGAQSDRASTIRAYLAPDIVRRRRFSPR